MRVQRSLVWCTALVWACIAFPASAQEKTKEKLQEKAKQPAKGEQIVKKDQAAAATLSKQAHAKFEVAMLELELKLEAITAKHAEIELHRVKQHLASLGDETDPQERVAMEIKAEQIALEVQSRQVETEMARLRLEHAKFQHQLLQKSPVTNSSGKEKSPIPVKVEIDDDAGVITIRGPREGVEKLKSVIEKLAKQSQ